MITLRAPTCPSPPLMKKTVWTLQILLALAFAGSGSMKLFQDGATLRADPRMGWSTGFTDTQIKLIGGAEVAGAVGLIAPAALGIAPVLTPIAGIALSVLMAGGAFTHLQRQESPVAPAVLGVLALVVAILRFRLADPKRAP
jgi:hypothetical protein